MVAQYKIFLIHIYKCRLNFLKYRSKDFGKTEHTITQLLHTKT